MCLCLLRGEAALAPPSARGAPPSPPPPPPPGDPLVSPAPPHDNRPSLPLLARLNILVGGETDRMGLWASRGGEVLNWTGGRDPVVSTLTSSSLLPEEYTSRCNSWINLSNLQLFNKSYISPFVTSVFYANTNTNTHSGLLV